MTYLWLCVGFLAVAVVVAVIAWRRAPRGHAAALALAAVALIVLTVLFDTLMIAADLFAYRDEHLAGLRLGLAPVEDLTYPLAALLLGSAVWNLTARRDGSAADAQVAASTDARGGTDGR